MNTRSTRFSSLGSIAGHVAFILRQVYGRDPVPTFNKADIEMRQAFAPGSRIPTEEMLKLWNQSVTDTRDPGFGFTAGKNIQPASLQGLGFSLLCSDTLGDALNRISRFSRLASTIANVDLVEHEQSVDFVVTPLTDISEFGYTRMDFGLSTTLQMSRIITGLHIKPIKLEMIRPRPEKCFISIDRFISAPIIYKSKTNSISFTRQAMTLPALHANPALAMINDQAVMSYLEKFDRESISMQVRSRIIEQLPDGTPRQEDIAKSVHMSLRGLQRKLSAEGTSYRGLLEKTRSELATVLLKDPCHSLGEITYQLGFSDQANFTRAFKRWTGMSPSKFRQSTLPY